MARYRASIDTEWAPEEAFDYLSDFTSSAEWDPGVVEARRVASGPVRVGTEFRLVAAFLGRRTPITYRVTVYEPPSAVTFLGENATVTSHDRIAIEAVDGVTRVSYDAELRLKGVLRLAAPLLSLAFDRLGERALAGLRSVLSGPGAKATGAPA